MTTSEEQKRAWWAQVADALHTIAVTAPEYLPDRPDDPAVDPRAADDVEQALLSARFAADAVVGGYDRVCRARQADLGQRSAPPAPALTPAPVARPVDRRYAPSITRGWA